MSADSEKPWETALDRELKSLPDLPAPATLIPRVLAGLERLQPVPWYQQPWPQWPAGLRGVSLIILLALFGGLSFAGWKASQTEAVAIMTQSLTDWFSIGTVVWAVLITLGSTLLVVVKSFGSGFMIAWGIIAVLSYVACVGLGTIFVRFAFARPKNSL